eukprot:363974-Chlamydomonas_euryale.AAC.16
MFAGCAAARPKVWRCGRAHLEALQIQQDEARSHMLPEAAVGPGGRPWVYLEPGPDIGRLKPCEACEHVRVSMAGIKPCSGWVSLAGAELCCGRVSPTCAEPCSWWVSMAGVEPCGVDQSRAYRAEQQPLGLCGLGIVAPFSR